MGCCGKFPDIGAMPPLHCPAGGCAGGGAAAAGICWPGIGGRNPAVTEAGAAGVQLAPPVLLWVFGEFHCPLVIRKYQNYFLQKMVGNCFYICIFWIDTTKQNKKTINH